MYKLLDTPIKCCLHNIFRTLCLSDNKLKTLVSFLRAIGSSWAKWLRPQAKWSNYPAHYMISVQIWVTDITRSILVTSMGEIDINSSGERPKFKGSIVVSYIYTCTSELFFSWLHMYIFLYLVLKKIVPLRRIFNACIFLDDDLFSQGLVLSRHMQQLPGEWAAFYIQTETRCFEGRPDLS